MKKVNLKDLYFYINKNIEVEVDDEVYEVFELSKKKESAYYSKKRYHNAIYSLDCNDGIENDAVIKVMTPEELFRLKERQLAICNALKSLPDIQSQRIIMFFYYDMSVTDIARLQGVNPSSVSRSIMNGLKRLKKFEY